MVWATENWHTYLESSMYQLSKDVCILFLALFCQKLLVHMCFQNHQIRVGEMLPRPTKTPLTFDRIKLQKCNRHNWKAESLRISNTCIVFCSFPQSKVKRVQSWFQFFKPHTVNLFINFQRPPLLKCNKSKKLNYTRNKALALYKGSYV